MFKYCVLLLLASVAMVSAGYGQWMSANVTNWSDQSVVVTAQVSWGKLHPTGDQDKELQNVRYILDPKRSAVINAIGRKNTPTGTSGQILLSKLNRNSMITFATVDFDVPNWGSNKLVVNSLNITELLVQTVGPISTSGPLGNVALQVLNAK
jgi:hypothetical protein